MGDFDQSGDPNSFTSSEFFTMAFLAAYGISAAFLSVGALMKAVEVVALILTVLSVYSMLKAGDELGGCPEWDCREKAG